MDGESDHVRARAAVHPCPLARCALALWPHTCAHAYLCACTLLQDDNCDDFIAQPMQMDETAQDGLDR